MKQKQVIVVFHPALAPYRVDFFNALHRSFSAHFYFNCKNVGDQKFDQESLRTKSEFNMNFLEKGFEYRGKSFRSGIISALKKHRPNIILCSEYGPLTLWIFLYVKLFQPTIRVYTISDDSVSNAAERKGLRKFLRNFIAKHSNGVLFTSQEVCQWHRNKVSKNINALELPIIHNDSLLREQYSQSLATANESIEKYGLAGKKITLFVGRLVDVKNLPFLLHGFSKIENANCKLILVGEGPLRAELESLAHRLNIADKVIFAGRREGTALYNFYTFAQIFAFPSTNERYGAVVNEALLGGCYTLCSEAAGASSLIDLNNGRVFNPFDEDDFVAKLNIAVRNATPLPSAIHGLRPSTMPFTFKDKISTLIAQL